MPARCFAPAVLEARRSCGADPEAAKQLEARFRPAVTQLRAKTAERGAN